MSAIEKITVSISGDQLFVEAWLVEDEQFRDDLEAYEASIDARTAAVNQPATVRMADWWVQAVNDDGSDLNVMRQLSGGSGTEGLMEWILWPLRSPKVDVVLRHHGVEIWKVIAFEPPQNQLKRPLSRGALQIMRPMTDRS